MATKKNKPRSLFGGRKHKWEYRQYKVRGGRIPQAGSFEPRVAARLKEECLREDSSPPRIISLALAEYFGIKIDEQDTDAHK